MALEVSVAAVRRGSAAGWVRAVERAAAGAGQGANRRRGQPHGQGPAHGSRVTNDVVRCHYIDSLFAPMQVLETRRHRVAVREQQLKMCVCASASRTGRFRKS